MHTIDYVFFNEKIYFFDENNSYIGIFNLFWFLIENPFRIG